MSTIKIKPSHPSQGDFVVINESDFDPKKHERYIAPPPAPPAAVLPPPPPPPADPLDGLAKNWRDGKPQDLRTLANSITGRMPENKPQAIEMIEAALAARSK